MTNRPVSRDRLPLIRTEPYNTSNGQGELLEQSSDMLAPTSALEQLRQFLLCTREEREQRKKLITAVLSEAERIQQVALHNKAELSRLAIAVKYQIEKDELRIAHRHAMTQLSKGSEDQLACSLNRLFVDKKKQLEKIAEIHGDPALMEAAAQYIAELTIDSANELIARNNK